MNIADILNCFPHRLPVTHQRDAIRQERELMRLFGNLSIIGSYIDIELWKIDKNGYHEEIKDFSPEDINVIRLLSDEAGDYFCFRTETDIVLAKLFL